MRLWVGRRSREKEKEKCERSCGAHVLDNSWPSSFHPFQNTHPAAVRAVARVLNEPASTAVSTMSLVPTLEAAKRAVDGREVGVGSMKAEAVAVQARMVAKARMIRICVTVLSCGMDDFEWFRVE